jgi:hypothetical protein
MRENSRFQKLLVLLGVASFGLTLWLMARAGAPDPTFTTGGNAESRSAIGYKALAQTLERVGVRVATARHAPVERAAAVEDSVLVLTEPPSEHGINELIEGASEAEVRVLVVLPKWNGTPSLEQEGWVTHLSLKPANDVSQMLNAFAHAVYVTRLDSTELWQAQQAPGSLALPATQLVQQGDDGPLTPLLSSSDGILFGQLKENPNVYVLSDPDLINNAGLAEPANARAFGALLKEHLLGPLFVFDETLHGFERTPSLFHELSQFPLLPVTLHACLLFLLGVWATSTRFGAPVEASGGFARGKQRLLENTVGLLEHSRYLGYSLSSYLTMTLRRAAHALSLSTAEAPQARAARLAVVAKARGVRRDIQALTGSVEDAATRAELARTLRLARELRAWSKELSGESGRG